MLKLLESKDLLRAVYVIPPDPEIHGRSKVMFVPAEKSIDLVFRPLGGEGVKREQLRNFLIRAMEKATSTYDGFWKDWPDDMQDLLAIAAQEDETLLVSKEKQAEIEEWEDLKGTIFSLIKRRRKSNSDHIIYELSALVKTAVSPQALCAEIITAILLIISNVEYSNSDRKLLNIFLELPFSKDIMLMLFGLALGLTYSNKKARKYLGDFQNDIVSYIDTINKVEPEDLIKLHEFTCEIWDYIRKGS